MIICCLGGVDVGKSSLISRILIETGCVNNREIARILKESNIIKRQNQWLANIVDTDKNERESGVTLEPSIESFTFNNKTFKIINNPGHSSLMQKIIKTTSQSDLGLLVLPAKQNEFNKSLDAGFEYALIARVLNINKLIVCINKSEKLDLHEYSIFLKQIKQRLKKLSFDKLFFCPVSALYSKNIANHDFKYTESSLLDIISSININRKQKTYVKPIENNINFKLIFHNIPAVISAGFKCNLHSSDKVYEIELLNINCENKSFITINDIHKEPINCTISIQTNDYLDQSCLLTLNNTIIAYGVLY